MAPPVIVLGAIGTSHEFGVVVLELLVRTWLRLSFDQKTKGSTLQSGRPQRTLEACSYLILDATLNIGATTTFDSLASNFKQQRSTFLQASSKGSFVNS